MERKWSDGITVGLGPSALTTYVHRVDDTPGEVRPTRAAYSQS